MKKCIVIVILIIVSSNLISAQNSYNPNKMGGAIQLTGEDYMTGEDGVPRMTINIWGKVKYPGAYLVYDQIDLLTCLSLAGGPIDGANLKKVLITSRDGSSMSINLNEILNNESNQEFFLKPHDTVFINETLANKILNRSNFINTFLQLTNLI